MPFMLQMSCLSFLAPLSSTMTHSIGLLLKKILSLYTGVAYGKLFVLGKSPYAPCVTSWLPNS